MESTAAAARQIPRHDRPRESSPEAVTAIARELAGFVWAEMTS
jgi:hypothetical protein